MDMNDRALREIVVSAGSKKEGVARRTGFVITAASEIMAIIALAKDRADLRGRLDRIVVGITRTEEAGPCRDLQATGAMMALLTEAIQPNLVRTVEGVPAFVHAGPLANIAHGTSSVISQEMGLRLADYVVNECGFAADLGAEKYIDIVYRSTGVSPLTPVLVTTVQSLRNQGRRSGEEFRTWCSIYSASSNCRQWWRSTVFRKIRMRTSRDWKACQENGALSARHTAFANGGAGSEELARRVVEIIEKNPGVRQNQFTKRKGLWKRRSRRLPGNLWGRRGDLERESQDEAAGLYGLGLRQIAGVHRQDTVLVFGQSETDGRAEGLGVERYRCVALGGSGIWW